MQKNRDSPNFGNRGASVSNRNYADDDKISIYRMIKSTEANKGTIDSTSSPSKVSPTKRESIDWRSKPDVTGVRMNNKIIKSQPHEIQGVTCMKVPIFEVPLLKRHSMIIPSTTTTNPRTFSSSSTRRKVSINTDKNTT